jgi:polar amino acid transport system substrate-binding protein
MNKSTKLFALLSGVVLAAAACSSSTGGASTAPTAAAPSAAAPSAAAPSAAPSAGASAAPSEAAASVDPNSLLGKVLAAKTLRISTDPNYKPFSFLNTTTNTYEGFDTSTAEETAKRLGAMFNTDLKVQWEIPSWDAITAGSWGGRWDISIGSMSVTNTRAKVVDFADPYYYDSGAVAVPKDSPVQSLTELAGKTFCVGAATTYEQWLKGTLDIVDPNVVTPPATDPGNVTSLPTDNECVQAVKAGRKFDAIVANANGLADAVRDGQPIRVLDGPPIFTVQVSFALDKSGPNTASMLTALNKIVADMHSDGTLTQFSNKWLQKDVTVKPS